MAIIAESALSTLWVGDVPESPMRWDFFDEFGNPVQIGDWDHWKGTLYSPAGVSLGVMTGTEHGQHLDISFTGPSLATAPGVYSMVFQFWNVTNAPVTAVPFEFAVEARDGWLSIYEARNLWADAPTNDVQLFRLLDAAKAQCISYGPTIAPTESVPVTYRQAQLMQVRALYMSFISNQNDSVGVDGYQVRTFPLDWNIKALLRPKSGKPVLG